MHFKTPSRYLQQQAWNILLFSKSQTRAQHLYTHQLLLASSVALTQLLRTQYNLIE